MKRTFLIIVVIAAAMMELIDVSIVNVALSQISGNLGATIEDTSWVITAYAIANVIIIPMTSFLAARLGRRNYYIASVLVFTFFSFLCGQATNIWALVGFRFIQGIGGGALLSVSQAIVFDLFPRDKQNVASALFGIGVFIGPTIGPTLGGFITEYYSWPWIFLINVPIGFVVSTLCYFLLSEPPIRPAKGKVDWLGIFLLAMGIGALQVVLERGEIEDWFETGYITVTAIIAFFSLFFFVWRELSIKNPVVNLRVLASKNLSIAAVLTFISGIGIFSSVFLTPVYAQRLLSFTPAQTGLLLLPGACFAIVGLVVSARLLQRGISPLVMITVGMLLFVLFSWQMSTLNLQVGAADITVPLIWRALGLAIITVPLTTLAVSSLRPVEIPTGAALNNMMRQLGGSVGLAAVNTFLVYRNAQHRSDIVSHISGDNILARDRINSYTNYFLTNGHDPFQSRNMAIKTLDMSVARQSNLLSFSDAYLLIGAVFIVALPLLLYAGSNRNIRPETELSDH